MMWLDTRARQEWLTKQAALLADADPAAYVAYPLDEGDKHWTVAPPICDVPDQFQSGRQEGVEFPRAMYAIALDTRTLITTESVAKDFAAALNLGRAANRIPDREHTAIRRSDSTAAVTVSAAQDASVPDRDFIQS